METNLFRLSKSVANKSAPASLTMSCTVALALVVVNDEPRELKAVAPSAMARSSWLPMTMLEMTTVRPLWPC